MNDMYESQLTVCYPSLGTAPQGLMSVGPKCLVLVMLGSCFWKWRLVCPLSLTSERAVSISKLLSWDKWAVEPSDTPDHYQLGLGKSSEQWSSLDSQVNEAVLNFVLLASWQKPSLVISILNLQFHNLYPSSVIVTHAGWLLYSQILSMFLHMRFIFLLVDLERTLLLNEPFHEKTMCSLCHVQTP